MQSGNQIERDRELWNSQIHWLLNIAPAELGEKSTLGSVVSALEHGGYHTGVPSTDLDDYKVGWQGESPASKWRRLHPIWCAVDKPSQVILMAHYRVSTCEGLPETMRVAVEGALGKLANASVWVHEGEALAKLITACWDRKTSGRDGIIRGATTRTDKRVRAAHRAWQAVTQSRREWILGHWFGYPLGREIACPQCGYTTMEFARAWARSEPLPEECRNCFAELRTPRETVPERISPADASTCCAETVEHSNETEPKPEVAA